MKRSAAPSQRLNDESAVKLGVFSKKSKKHELESVQQCESGSSESGKISNAVETFMLHSSRVPVYCQKFQVTPFKIPIKGYGASTLGGSLGMRKSFERRALHDPTAPNALVLHSPAKKSTSSIVGNNEGEIHVVVDPLLSDRLRPHQREGVKFLWECVTGQRIPGCFGAIMADEMGLGKTLQIITLLWTLLCQSSTGNGVIRNAVVVTPSSLVKNWESEFLKWLNNRIETLSIDGGSKASIDRKLESFVMAPVYTSNARRILTPSVLIISYETFRIHTQVLTKGEIGILICDEGHRLKNKDNLTYTSLAQLKCKRRIILSGTPIQNDLLEYFSLLHFVNEGILGTIQEFRKNFEIPILKSRDTFASDKDREAGQSKLKELSMAVEKCMIRRTASLLTQYLPQKVDLVICCRLSPAQVTLYKRLTSDLANESRRGSFNSLSAITKIKKLVNHPDLISESGPTRKLDVKLSGKFMVLQDLLFAIRKISDDKIVLVSNYTQTLDLFEILCRDNSFGYVRLDGSMGIKKRMQVVDRFNDPTNKNEFIFMLSSKAGGCGLNLIGANRLIMFDPDWNPANDAQAMARVWRDGQKKRCFVYRFLATGTLDERIFQRQNHKRSLSCSVVDQDEEQMLKTFDLKLLKSLFVLNEITDSDTRDQLKCARCINGHQVVDPPVASADSSSTDLANWNHSNTLTALPDSALKSTFASGQVSFVFHQLSHVSHST